MVGWTGCQQMHTSSVCGCVVRFPIHWRDSASCCSLVGKSVWARRCKLFALAPQHRILWFGGKNPHMAWLGCSCCTLSINLTTFVPSVLPLFCLCRNTPGLLSTAGLLAAAAAAALVYFVPDDSTPLVAAQVAGASALGAAAIATFVGSSILGNLQKV